MRLLASIVALILLGSAAFAQPAPGTINLRDATGTTHGDYNIAHPNAWTFSGPMDLDSLTVTGAASIGSLTLGTPLPVGSGGTGVASFVAGTPLLGNGTSPLTQGTISGTTTVFPVLDSAAVSGECARFDSSGGLVPTACAGFIANASGSDENTTATCSSGDTAVTLAAAEDFIDGQGIALEHCGATFSGASPSGLAVSPHGPTGSTSYAYRIACLDANGGVGAAISPVSISNGYATLGTIIQSSRQFSYNNVSWSTTCPAIAVWRSKSAGAYQLLGAFLSSETFTDSGLPQVTIPWIPATPPASALNDRLVTTISSGAGTVSITVADAPGNDASGAYARHDDTAALNAYLSANPNVHLPAGTFNIEAITLPTSVAALYGEGASTTVLAGWSLASPIITASGMPDGFRMSDMSIVAPAGTVWKALQVSSTTGCWLRDMSLSGGLGAILMTSTTRCSVVNNHIDAWYHYAIHDQSGNGDTISGNIVTVGSLPATGEAITLAVTNNSTVEGNTVLGGDYFAFLIDGGSHNRITGNTSLNSNNESYHIAGYSGSASWNQITDNTADSQDYSIDFCISISEDNANSVIMEENLISGNYLRYCGISAIGLDQLAGSSPQFIYNIVTNNTIFASNADAQAGMPDIWISGSGFTYTMVSGNTFMSGSGRVDYNIKELDTGNGLPDHTQVGANYGLVGASGFGSLTGTGSATLSGGGTGL